MDPGGAASRPASADPPGAVPFRDPAFLAVLAVVAGCVAFTVTFRLWDTDFWQHLIVGREIVASGRVPRVHLWSWPTYGLPEVTPSWAFRALLWPFWQAGGVWGAFAWRWITTLAAFGLLLATARRMGARGFSALVVMAWAALPWAQRSQLRPETLVAVLFALQLWIHETRRAGGADGGPGADRTMWLPVVALAWANVHISWWLGLAVQAIYFLDAWWSSRGRRGDRSPLLRLAVIGLISGAASFANPFGWRALAQPFEYWLDWRHEPIFRIVSELEPVDWRANVRNLLPLLFLAWPTLAIARLRRRGLDPAEALLGALLLALALSAQRFVGFLALAGAPFIARDLAGILRGPERAARPAGPRNRAALAAALAVGGSLAEWTDPARSPGVGIDPRAYPVAACDFIEREGVRGRGFNPFAMGGYLLWRFHPGRDRLPFMDIHQSGTREDRLLAALATTRDDAWRELDRRHRFDWVLLNRRHVTDERSLDILDADSAFALVFLDDNAALYARRSGAMGALAERRGYRLLVAGREATRGLGEAAADPARRPALESEIARLRAESPFHAGGLLLEANLRVMDGRPEEARAALRDALAIDPDFPFANQRLAAVALELGRPREAARALRREISLQGRTASLAALLERARAMERETRERRRTLARALARSPGERGLADSLRATDGRLEAPRIVPRSLPAGPLMPRPFAAAPGR